MTRNGLTTITTAEQNTGDLPAGASFVFNVDSPTGRETVYATVLGMLPDGRVKARVTSLNDTHRTATKVGDVIGVPRNRVIRWTTR